MGVGGSVVGSISSIVTVVSISYQYIGTKKVVVVPEIVAISFKNALATVGTVNDPVPLIAVSWKDGCRSIPPFALSFKINEPAVPFTPSCA